MFYDKLFSSLDFTLPRAATGRRGFPKEAMVCAFIVMKCEGFSQITDLMDYLDNNRLIAHYCGFNIMEPLPSYWTYDRFLRQLNNGALKRSSRSVLLLPPARWTTRHCWRGCGCTVSDPLLTQNGIGTGRAGRKQRNIRRANGGKKHKSEPK